MGNNDEGFCWSDDFKVGGGPFTTNTTDGGGFYGVFTDDGPIVGPNDSGDELTGVIKFQMSTGDDEEATIALGGSGQAICEINSTSGSDFDLWFECRVKFSNVSDTICKNFIGLGAEDAAANGQGLDAAGLVMTDNGWIGFIRQEDDGNAINFIYAAAGQTEVEHITGVTAITADTYVNLGFRYQPTAVPAKRIAIFVDGVEQGTYVTQTNIDVNTFPEGEPLTMVATAMNAATTDNAFEMDWWAIAQRLA